MNPNVFSILTVIDKFTLTDVELRELSIAINKKVNTDLIQPKVIKEKITPVRETQQQVYEAVLNTLKKRKKRLLQ